MKELLFDKNLRVRKVNLNITAFYMLLVGFLYSLLISAYADALWSITLSYALQPFVVFGIPSVILIIHEKKYTKTLTRIAYDDPPLHKTDFLYTALFAIAAWLCYTYFSYAVEGFRAAATGGLTLHVPVRPALWQLIVSVSINGILAACLREYFFRYLGRKAYGRTVWGYLLISVLSAVISYDIGVAIRLLALGLCSGAIYFGTKRFTFSILFAIMFESFQTIVPSYWTLPLSTLGATSVETSLLYALYCSAVTLFLAVGIYWLFHSVRYKLSKKAFVCNRAAVATYALCIVGFIALLIWNKFI